MAKINCAHRSLVIQSNKVACPQPYVRLSIVACWPTVGVPTSAGQLATLPRVRHSFLLNGPDPVRHAGKWVIQRRMLPRCYLLPLKLSTMLNTFFNGLTMCQHVGLDNGQRMTKNTFVGSLQGKLKKPHLHIH